MQFEDSNIRVFFINTYSDMARQIICEVNISLMSMNNQMYRHNLFTPSGIPKGVHFSQLCVDDVRLVWRELVDRES